MRRIATDQQKPRFYDGQQTRFYDLINAAGHFLRDFQFSKGISILMDAYIDGAKVADLIGEVVLLHDHDIDKAKEWFKKSESIMGFFIYGFWKKITVFYIGQSLKKKLMLLQ